MSGADGDLGAAQSITVGEVVSALERRDLKVWRSLGGSHGDSEMVTTFDADGYLELWAYSTSTSPFSPREGLSRSDGFIAMRAA